MSPRLFCVALCLLNAGFVDAGVSQTPRYCVISAGKKMILECSQDMNHYSMFWYRQDPGQGLTLLHYSGSVSSTAKGDAPEGYSVSREKSEHFPLTLESASTSQTSLYLCASSGYTARHGQLLTVQKEQPSGGGRLSLPGRCLNKEKKLSPRSVSLDGIPTRDKLLRQPRPIKFQ